ncbi:MAG: hypothetical protein HKN51_17740 [Saprospiraceae bacterium]|nr:hypothetical protein [Bacteroidia bacterium]NNE16830.1 hypothetical protein [Saprospiraceae bacterium]
MSSIPKYEYFYYFTLSIQNGCLIPGKVTAHFTKQDKIMAFKNQAIGESILWWFRDEYWMHRSFQNIEHCLKNGLHKIFSEKVISVFLSRYSIRRTIQAGSNFEELFTHELVNTSFLSSVKNGEFEALDQFSTMFESSSKSSVKSALSKFATLYNPNEYIMYDSRSRKGMHRIRNLISNRLNEKITYAKIDIYSNYVKYAKSLSEEYEDEKLVGLLSNLDKSKVKDFLLQNINAFKLRIVDKWLWLEGYNDIKPSKIKTSDYIDLVNNER